MISKILPTLAIASLLLVSIGTIAEPTPEGETWAFIIAPTHEGGTVYEDASDMYDYFKDVGIDDTHIIFLTDGSTESYVDGDATESEIEKSFDYLAENVGIFDDIIIVLGDDGVFSDGHAKIVCSDNNQVSDETFAAWVDDIDCSRMVVILSFDYSGGFIDDLSAPGRLILTSHSSTESTWTNAYNLADGLTDPMADDNQDGKVSFEEAHAFASDNTLEQTPQMNTRIVGEYTL